MRFGSWDPHFLALKWKWRMQLKWLGGDVKHILFSPLLGKEIQFCQDDLSSSTIRNRDSRNHNLNGTFILPLFEEWPNLIGKMVVPLIMNLWHWVFLGYITVYPLLKGSLEGFSQLGALHPPFGCHSDYQNTWIWIKKIPGKKGKAWHKKNKWISLRFSSVSSSHEKWLDC